MRTSSRYHPMMAIAMAAALALATAAAAPAHSAAWRNPRPRQALPPPGTLRIAGKITIPAVPGIPAGKVYGYALCLYHATHWHCATDDVKGNSRNRAGTGVATGTSGNASSELSAIRTDHAILVDLGEIGGVITVWQFANAAAGKAIKLIARWWWGKDAGPNGGSYPIKRDPFNGKCMGDWGAHADVTEGSCRSRHAIYWQVQRKGKHDFRFWNTDARGDLIASSLGHPPLFCRQPPEDYSTWEFVEVVSS